MDMSTVYTTRLLKKTYLTRDVVELVCEKPADFEFAAGQFVQWEIPDGSNKPILRSYSLSSTPADNSLEFCLKLLPLGKASFLADKIAAGDILKFQGPNGRFINTQTKPLYLIATGVGISPIVSILRDELENKKTDSEVRLLFGVRSEKDIFWQDRLERLKSQFSNFQFQISLSQPNPNNGWTGLRGRVTEHILHHLVDHQFYLCGNADMVKDVRQLLLKNGIDAAQVHFEIF